MGCGCAERRAKMKAWVKREQQKRIAKKLEKKKVQMALLEKKKKELDDAAGRGN